MIFKCKQCGMEWGPTHQCSPEQNSGEGNYAISLSDAIGKNWEAGPFNMVGMLIGPVTENKVMVEIKKDRPDMDAVVLECGDEQAEAIITVLNLKGFVRAFKKGPKGGWKAIPRDKIGQMKHHIKHGIVVMDPCVVQT